MKISTAFAFVALPLIVAHAETRVGPGESIQAAIDAAAVGERIVLGAGVYEGNLDFRGKAVRVVGVGPESVIRGDGTGTVIRFAAGEGRTSVLDSVQVTGGVAEDGGGILIANASPLIQRTVIFDNQADGSGAGIYVRGSGSRPLIRNNVFAYNLDPRPQATSDAHQVFVDGGSSAVILNNTLVRGNGNAIFLSGSSRSATVMNNLLVMNGSRLPGGGVTGRGICDFSGSARIQNNLFFRNSRSAVLTGDFEDYRLVTDAEVVVGESRFRDNQDGDPGFRRRAGRAVPAELNVENLILRGRSPAKNAGKATRRLRDRDGSRNDVGHTGGPAGWR